MLGFKKPKKKVDLRTVSFDVPPQEVSLLVCLSVCLSSNVYFFPFFDC